MNVGCLYYHNRNEPEYSLSFEEQERQSGAGRTPSEEEAINAVGRWLSGISLEALYQSFEFVDRQQRDLSRIVSEVLVLVPELSARVSPEIRQIVGDLYELWFSASARACMISFYGNSRAPDCLFSWDSCEMFKVRTSDSKLIGQLLKRWICEAAAPSTIKAEVPSIEVSPIARYYEEGRPVEGEFICSWDGIEQFYRDFLKEWDGSPLMLRLLSQMRQAGYDRSLRAGQSMQTLMLSRSRRHGLRSRQPFIAIDVVKNGMTVTASFAKKENFEVRDAALVPELERVLRRLLEAPIA